MTATTTYQKAKRAIRRSHRLARLSHQLTLATPSLCVSHV